MPLDRALGKEDPLGDLLVAEPECDELGDLLTPRGQLDSSLHCDTILILRRAGTQLLFREWTVRPSRRQIRCHRNPRRTVYPGKGNVWSLSNTSDSARSTRNGVRSSAHLGYRTARG